MRRIPFTLAALVAMTLALAPAASAQEGMSATADHPVVGAWIMEDGGTAVFHGDGTFLGIDPEGGVAAGVWAPTGERSVDLTFRIGPSVDGTPAGLVTARTAVEVSEDGMTSMIDATIEMPTPDGGTTGQLGPIEFTGARVVVEPQGEPVGPFPPPEG